MFRHLLELNKSSLPYKALNQNTFFNAFHIFGSISCRIKIKDHTFKRLYSSSISRIPTWNQINGKYKVNNVSNTFIGSFPQNNNLDLLRELISNELQDIIKVSPAEIFRCIIRPNKLNEGDLILPLQKLKPTRPFVDIKQVSETCQQKLHKLEYIENVINKGNFLQFFIDKNFLIESTLSTILHGKENYGSCPLVKDKKIIIEFSSPNIAKPFHAGHLRSTIIGGYLSNIHKLFGWKVIKMNYLGDWGKQFAILVVGFEKYGNYEQLKLNSINHLFEVYVKINKDIEREKDNNDYSTMLEAREYFHKLENGDPKVLRLWNLLRNLSIKEYVKTYSKLNIKFDVYAGESQVSKNKIGQILFSLKEKKLIELNNGALVVDLTSVDPKLGSIIVSKSDDTSLYITRDICTAIERKTKYQFDKMIYVIASQQDLYMKQLFTILKQLDCSWVNQLEHINFGMVLGMSTRKGNVVFLDTIINEATKRVQHRIEDKFPLLEPPRLHQLAENIGLSAIVIQDMQSKRINNYEFKWDRILSFEGDTGPYLQYQHARLCSILKDFNRDVSFNDVNLNLLQNSSAFHLIRLLGQYPDILRQSYDTKEPSKIVKFLFKLSHQFSACYKTLWINGQPEEVANAHYVLYQCIKQVLANGLVLLGLNPVDQM